MKELTLGLVIFGWFSSILYSKYVVRTFLNPILIFTSIWLAVLYLFHARFLNYYPLENETYLTISVGYISYTFGLMIPFLFYNKEVKEEVDYRKGFPHFRFNLSLYIIFILSLLGLFLFYLDITRFFKLSELLSPFKYQQLRTMIIDNRIGGRLIDYLTLWGEIALILSVFYAVYFKKNYFRIFLFFLPALTYSLLATGRAQIFAVLFDLFGAYIFVKVILKREKLNKIYLVLFPLLLIFAFGAIGVHLIKSTKFMRHIDTKSIVESQLYMMYFYMTGSIGALNRFLLDDSEILEYGRYTLAPLIRILSYFFNDLEVPPSIQPFLKIPYWANVYTYLYVLYKDFGFAGVAAIPFLIGSIVSSIWRKFSHRMEIVFLPLICHFSFVIFMTTFHDLFFRTTPVLIYLYTLLFLKVAGVRTLVRSN